MLSTLIVQTRSEFEGLHLDLYSDRFRFRVTGDVKREVAEEIRHVFGSRVAASQLAQYFYHPARVSWRVSHATPGNYVDRGESEILDHTFWACRDMFISIAGTEPHSLCRMLLAQVTATALEYDTQTRKHIPSSFLEAVDVFKSLARNPFVSDQKRFKKVYMEVKSSYEAMPDATLRREYKQTMRVICLLMSYFSRDFADLGDSLPWFNLLEIVYGREHVGMGRYECIRPILTSTDLANITQMLLGVDTTHLAQSPLPANAPFLLPAT
jgi:hypothetical protein